MISWPFCRFRLTGACMAEHIGHSFLNDTKYCGFPARTKPGAATQLRLRDHNPGIPNNRLTVTGDIPGCGILHQFGQPGASPSSRRQHRYCRPEPAHADVLLAHYVEKPTRSSVRMRSIALWSFTRVTASDS